MQGMRLCLSLALLLPWCSQGQRMGFVSDKVGEEDTESNLLSVNIVNRSGILGSLLPQEFHPTLRQARAPRPYSQVPKRAQQGSRFALSLDVPTSILSVLIDLAKNHDMRAKAAANAELMARIGRRK
ncbi:urocortin 3, like [Esox lucius]|uniref:Corticotropin-releasing factor domain-containing protein n=1 Tax=Esox lucius TaxID=8010 RepID=A0A3P8XJU6_ESOLU|nr:urocortin 3, like [Esox lucius]